MKIILRILGAFAIGALTFTVARAGGSPCRVALLAAGAAVIGTVLNWV